MILQIASRRAHLASSFVIFVAVMSLIAQPATAQGPQSTSTTDTYTPPRTPNGHPDLQGVWVNTSATPFERPAALAGRALLTDEEVAELTERANRIFKESDADLPVGDNLFLTALADAEAYKNPRGANRSSSFMVERAFDRRTSLVIDPPDGKLPPMMAKAQRRRAEASAKNLAKAGPEDITNLTRCVTPGIPRIGPRATGDPLYGYQQIFQSPDYVVLLLESFGDLRIVPLDGRPHLSRGIRQWLGDSRGRWDGDTLVVESTNFSAKSDFLGSADNLHVVERLTRVASDEISYEVTVDDPTTWATPWTAAIRLSRQQANIYEFACHEGNRRSMLSMLAIARAEEATQTDK